MLRRLEPFAHTNRDAWKGLVDSLAAMQSYEELIWQDKSKITHGCTVQQSKNASAVTRALNDLRNAAMRRHGRREMLASIQQSGMTADGKTVARKPMQDGISQEIQMAVDDVMLYCDGLADNLEKEARLRAHARSFHE